MSRRTLQLIVGLVLVAAGVYLMFSPLVVAEALGRPHATSSQMINLRATWGGAVAGFGAFVAWLPALSPKRRVVLGLLLTSMAGIGIARATGFVLDGHPDTLQWFWMIAEITIVAVCAVALRRISAGALPAK